MVYDYQCRRCKNDKCSFSWKDTDSKYMNCTNFIAPPPTNADKIRAMTDEELAEIITDDWCELLHCESPCDGRCDLKVLDWLKQKAET